MKIKKAREHAGWRRKIKLTHGKSGGGKGGVGKPKEKKVGRRSRKIKLSTQENQKTESTEEGGGKTKRNWRRKDEDKHEEGCSTVTSDDLED